MVWTDIALEMPLEHSSSGVETPQSDCCVFERHSCACAHTPVSGVLGTLGKSPFARRHLRGPAATPTRGVRRPLEHFRALPAHGPRNAG